MSPAVSRALLGRVCAATLVAQSAAIAGDCTYIEAASYRIDPRIRTQAGSPKVDDPSIAATKSAATALSSATCAACVTLYTKPSGSTSDHIFDYCVADISTGRVRDGRIQPGDKDYALALMLLAEKEDIGESACLGWGTLNRCKVYTPPATCVRVALRSYKKLPSANIR
jgi:hypothetical protein